jgi:DNA-binding YbaB/EbfC family protein
LWSEKQAPALCPLLDVGTGGWERRRQFSSQEERFMAKGKGQRIRASRPGGRPDMRQQIRLLQEQMLQTQEALGEQTVTATAGGGVVEVVMTGHQQVQSISIDPEVVNPEDVEMLQDLIMAAVNEAIEQSQALAAQQMGTLTGGLDLGNLGGLLG